MSNVWFICMCKTTELLFFNLDLGGEGESGLCTVTGVVPSGSVCQFLHTRACVCIYPELQCINF